MTKQEYEEAKIMNTRDLIFNLEKQLQEGTIAGKNKLAQAKRSLEKAQKYMKEYMTNFWNENNTFYYETLYKNRPLTDRKKDVSIW